VLVRQAALDFLIRQSTSWYHVRVDGSSGRALRKKALLGVRDDHRGRRRAARRLSTGGFHVEEARDDSAVAAVGRSSIASAGASGGGDTAEQATAGRPRLGRHDAEQKDADDAAERLHGAVETD